jgi:hypothetical protein
VKESSFRPIIFISHSARNDPAAHDTLVKLEQYLKDNGFDVLLDETRLQGGEPWRNRLHTWMAHCHGAIVLLTSKALESPWVLKEATILSWRYYLSGEKFPLLPVYLGLRTSDIENSKLFSPLALTEIEAIKGLTGLKLCKAMADLLGRLRSSEARTPQRLVEEKIAEWLSKVSRPALLTEVADKLGEDIRPWNPNLDPPCKIAMLLLQAPLEKLAEGLKPLIGAIPGEGIRAIVDMLRGSWVNREMAGSLIIASRRPDGMRAAALNATEQEFTARAVIARATGGHPPWYFVSVSDAAGEDVAGSLKLQVRAALVKAAGSKNPAIINSFIKSKVSREPLFIVLPPPEGRQPLLDDADVDALMSEYPSCTLFLMTGAALPADAKLPKVQRLRPCLGPDDETTAFVAFRDLELNSGVSK